MFQDTLTLKATGFALLLYIVVSNTLFGIAFGVMMPKEYLSNPDALLEWVQTTPALAYWEVTIGAVCLIFAGLLATKLSEPRGLKNALLVGVLLTVYSAYGVMTNPHHPLVIQIIKLVLPIPLCLLAGRIIWRETPEAPVATAA